MGLEKKVIGEEIGEVIGKDLEGKKKKVEKGY